MALHSGQLTLGDSVVFVGVGLHSGRRSAVRVSPAPAGHGIRFIRGARCARATPLLATWDSVVSTRRSTTLASPEGSRFCTVEHLLSALLGCGIDNARIELSGSEVPVMDGSARSFVDGFAAAKLVVQSAPRRVLVVERPIGVRDGERFALVAPSDARRFSVDIDFQNAAIGRQRFSFDLNGPGFRETIAPARTFGFAEELQRLHDQGLALGGSQRSAVVIEDERVSNTEGLRFDNEFARHKLLDLAGDVALAGMPVVGHFYGYCPGHKLNVALLSSLMRRPDCWSVRRADELPGEGGGDPLAFLLANPSITQQALLERLFGNEALETCGTMHLLASGRRAST